MGLADGGIEVVGAFPVEGSDGLVLVTNGGQLIRCPVGGVRIARRSTRGVKIFNVSEGDRVVSVTRLKDDGSGDDDMTEDGADDAGPESGGEDASE
jgi:DNA gyrase subunit A